MSIRRISLALWFSSCFLFSCSTAPDKESAGAVADSSQTSDSVDKQPAAGKILDTEAAETIIARYYSDLNRAAGYNHYKGLGLKILDIKVAEDSSNYLIYSENTGRIRKQNSGDTSTAAFSEKLTLKASFVNNNWEAEPIP